MKIRIKGHAFEMLHPTAAVCLGLILDRPGRPPSLREMGEATGLYFTGLAGHLRVLEAAGLIERVSNVGRGHVGKKSRAIRARCVFVPASRIGGGP